MTNEIREKAIELAASYFANWKACEAEHEYDDAAGYKNTYEGAMRMAAIMGIEASEIEDAAWKLYGDEIGKAYEDNNATW